MRFPASQGEEKEGRRETGKAKEGGGGNSFVIPLVAFSLRLLLLLRRIKALWKEEEGEARRHAHIRVSLSLLSFSFPSFSVGLSVQRKNRTNGRSNNSTSMGIAIAKRSQKRIGKDFDFSWSKVPGLFLFLCAALHITLGESRALFRSARGHCGVCAERERKRKEKEEEGKGRERGGAFANTFLFLPPFTVRAQQNFQWRKRVIRKIFAGNSTEQRRRRRRAKRVFFSSSALFFLSLSLPIPATREGEQNEG